ncbi:PTS system mannose/fructose/sorbose family transporter subunit IID, partial [Salmonella enterica subsp. enterica serovar Montevideo]|nr:PTS system mannose/fructose/sorbose family transporter subunit IID [Salmonella enterica subsp. enterica serovar Montevideo]
FYWNCLAPNAGGEPTGKLADAIAASFGSFAEFKAQFTDAAINGIKVGLMGPLAGVGDPIFWGTVRPVFAALGAGIAMSGSL